MIAALLLYSHVTLSTPRAARIAHQASAAVRVQTGIPLRLKPLRLRSIHAPRSPNDSALLSEYAGIYPNDPRLIVIIAPPPETPEGYQILKGMALVCSKRAVLTWLGSTHPMIQHANYRTLLHEIGHALGAEHTNDGSLMSPVIMPSVAFNADSVAQILKCYGE